MTEALHPFEPGILTEWPEYINDAVGDLTALVNHMSTSHHGREAIAQNMSAAMASPNTYPMATVSDNGTIISTLTVNANPCLRGDGKIHWIDDVITMPGWEGQGHYKKALAAGEQLVAELGGQSVYLSSSTARGRARQGYERGGYTLLNETENPEAQRVIYRSGTIGKNGYNPAIHEAGMLDDNFTSEEVGAIADLLGENPKAIERNLAASVASPTTRVYVARAAGSRVTGVAVANQTPIPVGRKPWISDIAGETPDDIGAAVAAAGSWLGSEYKHVNIVAPPDIDFGHSFVQRDSGLYVKPLGANALNGST